MTTVALGELMVARAGSVNPTTFPNERFELYSIPAHDRGGPEILIGSEIGSVKQIVQPGDVMISKIIPHIRRARVVGPFNGLRQIASGEWIVFRGDRFEPAYLRHFLLSSPFHGQFMNTVAGVGGSLVRARPQQVKTIELPLPPLSEQRRIAAILDRADELRAKRRRTLALHDHLTQSIFHAMFGDPLHDRFPTAPLGDLCALYSGGTPSKARADLWTGQVPWFSAKDIKTDDLTDSIDHIAEIVPRKTNLRLLPVGTVVMVVRGMILAHSLPISVLRVGATINQDLKALLPSEPIVPDFLASSLRAQRSRILSTVATAAHGTKKLDTDVLCAIRIQRPGVELEQKFARRVEQARAVRRTAEADQLDELFASLQSRAFAGQL